MLSSRRNVDAAFIDEFSHFTDDHQPLVSLIFVSNFDTCYLFIMCSLLLVEILATDIC